MAKTNETSSKPFYNQMLIQSHEKKWLRDRIPFWWQKKDKLKGRFHDKTNLKKKKIGYLNFVLEGLLVLKSFI